LLPVALHARARASKAELLFQNAVDELGLLLFTQLKRVPLLFARLALRFGSRLVSLE
jgi:hypothetical protein